MTNSNRASFGSKFGVYAAAVGSAVGLGNIWRFPYMTGENGGSAFILVYLLCVFLLGIPLVISELMLGRSGQGNSYRVFKNLAPGKPWFLVGLLGIFTSFIILSFYGTVAGWTLKYIYVSIENIFTQNIITNPGEMFENFYTSSFSPVFFQLLFMILTGGIIVFGVQKGIEKSSKIMLPMLFLIMVVLCIRSLTLPNAMEGIRFLFKPDFSKITGQVFLSTLGQSFFSLSIGMGALITYGSYVQKDNNLTKTSFAVSLTDTLVAILAGVMIFPALFSFGMSSTEGPGLVFVVLPEIFGQMLGGNFFSLLFFILLALAALTSSISLLEVIVLYLIEEFKMNRWIATFGATVASSVLGVFTTLSFGPLKDMDIFGTTLFGAADYFANNVLLPLGGLFTVIFVGWFLSKKIVKAELTNYGTIKNRLINIFFFVVKFIVPVAIVFMFLNMINVIKA
jgi:NSS family neurotransmitter:Na+ symporter